MSKATRFDEIKSKEAACMEKKADTRKMVEEFTKLYGPIGDNWDEDDWLTRFGFYSIGYQDGWNAASRAANADATEQQEAELNRDSAQLLIGAAGWKG
jgi:hypothetical protein